MNDIDVDSRIVVHESLRYVASTADFISDHALAGSNNKVLAKEILKSMRTHLSVPAIFSTLRVMRRLENFVNHAAEAYASGEVAFKPPKTKRCSVNFTMRIIYAQLVKRVYKKIGRSMENLGEDFNPFASISVALNEIIQYIAQKQFGIKIQ